MRCKRPCPTCESSKSDGESRIVFPNGGSITFDALTAPLSIAPEDGHAVGRVLSPHERASSYIHGSGVAFVSLDNVDGTSEPDTPDPAVVDVPALPRLFADVGELLANLADEG